MLLQGETVRVFSNSYLNLSSSGKTRQRCLDRKAALLCNGILAAGNASPVLVLGEGSGTPSRILPLSPLPPGVLVM